MRADRKAQRVLTRAEFTRARANGMLVLKAVDERIPLRVGQTEALELVRDVINTVDRHFKASRTWVLTTSQLAALLRDELALTELASRRYAQAVIDGVARALRPNDTRPSA